MSEPSCKDAELLAAARAGDPAALGEIFQIFRPKLLAAARREVRLELRRRGSDSDLVQETFLSAHTHFAQFRGTSPGQLFRWLLRILMNRIKMFRREQHAAARDTAREVHSEQVLNDFVPVVPDPHITPEFAAELDRAVKGLSDVQRTILVFRYRARLSYPEIAVLIGQSVDATRHQWYQAIAKIRQEFAERGLLDGDISQTE